MPGRVIDFDHLQFVPGSRRASAQLQLLTIFAVAALATAMRARISAPRRPCSPPVRRRLHHVPIGNHVTVRIDDEAGSMPQPVLMNRWHCAVSIALRAGKVVEERSTYRLPRRLAPRRPGRAAVAAGTAGVDLSNKPFRRATDRNRAQCHRVHQDRGMGSASSSMRTVT